MEEERISSGRVQYNGESLFQTGRIWHLTDCEDFRQLLSKGLLFSDVKKALKTM